MFSKSQNERFHAKKRFSERYDTEFNRHDRREAVDSIHKGFCNLIEKQSNNRFIYEIFLSSKKRRFKVVYNKRTDNIVTVLPEDWKNV